LLAFQKKRKRIPPKKEPTSKDIRAPAGLLAAVAGAPFNHAFLILYSRHVPREAIRAPPDAVHA
jgi:hypothetical protein